MFDRKSGEAVITDFDGDKIDLTALGFFPSEFEDHVTTEKERFLIDVDGDPSTMDVIRVEVGVELQLGDFVR